MLFLDTQIQNKATTQYLSYDVNSMCKVGSKHFAVGDSGLYQVTGTDDNGSAIAAYFEIAKLDFGTHRDKRIHFFYIGLYATNSLILTVSTELNSGINITIPSPGSGQREIRVPCPRSIHGVYWTIKISNSTVGTDFSIDYIKVLPIIR